MTHHRLWPALATHRGQRRHNNEDSMAYVYPDDPQILRDYGALFLVADGVGGLNNGEHYSSQAVQSICSLYYQTPANNVGERLARVLRTVNDQLYRLRQGGASTIVAAVLHGDSLTVASAGDSPAYAISLQGITKLTIDHVVDDPSNPKSKRLFRALGYEEALTVDCVTGKVTPGLRILLCSDGLTRYYTDAQLHSLCQPHSPVQTVQGLIHGAYLSGGTDNISAVMIEVGPVASSHEALRQHIASLKPMVTLPDELSNVAPLFPLYTKPYSIGEAAGTIMDSLTRKSYLRMHPLPLVATPAPLPPAPEQKLSPTPEPERRINFWEWIGRRPTVDAPTSNKNDVRGPGLVDHDDN